MSLPLPRYALARIADDGSCGEIEIYPLSEPPWEVGLDRRSFLRAGLSAAAALGALGGACVSAGPAAKRSAGEAAGKPTCDTARAHHGAVRSLAVSRDGATLASAGADDAVKLWSLPLGGLRQTLTDGYRDARALALAQDGEGLLVLSPGTLRRWRLSAEEGQPLEPQAAAGGESFLALSPTGLGVAVLTSAGRVEVRSLSGGEPRRLFDRPPEKLTLLFSGDGNRLAAEWEATPIVLFDLAQGSQRTLSKTRFFERVLALDAAGRWLAAADRLGLLELWPLDAEEPKSRSLESLEQSASTAAFSADGAVLAVGDDRGRVRLLQLPEGAVTATLEGKLSPVTALAFSPDRSLLIVGNEAGAIRLWGLPGGEARACFIDLAASPSSARGLRYEVHTAPGRIITYTAPCGSPVPPGATCTCNCVPGTLSPPVTRSSGGWWGGGSTYCSCNQVCVCIPVG
jgi:WD40 repeat protein